MADELRSGRGDIDAATRLRAALAAVQERIAKLEAEAKRARRECRWHGYCDYSLGHIWPRFNCLWFQPREREEE